MAYLRAADERLRGLIAWFVDAMLNNDTFRGLLNPSSLIVGRT